MFMTPPNRLRASAGAGASVVMTAKKPRIKMTRRGMTPPLCRRDNGHGRRPVPAGSRDRASARGAALLPRLRPDFGQFLLDVLGKHVLRWPLPAEIDLR